MGPMSGGVSFLAGSISTVVFEVFQKPVLDFGIETDVPLL
jgi:hypothetical protein